MLETAKDASTTKKKRTSLCPQYIKESFEETSKDASCVNKKGQVAVSRYCEEPVEETKDVSVRKKKQKSTASRYFEQSVEDDNVEHITEKSEKTTAPRYFGEPVEDDNVEHVKVKSKKKKFEGEIIKVDLNEQKPRRNRLRISKAGARQIKNNIPESLLAKYSRGSKVEGSGVKTTFFKEKQRRKEIYLDYATEQAARVEILLTEGEGFIEPDEEEITAHYTQEQIAENVSIQAAAKHFKLNLDFGPYNFRYTKDGRHLLLSGKRGHVAAFDWITKKLNCEMNVMEEVADVAWFHVPTMFACAQKDWVYVYDNQGTELHCVKRLYRVNRMEFLPYHFLLATGNSDGYLSWLDISIGELVGNYSTKLGPIRLMRQNPYNGVICVGDAKGIVSMWSPKVREPLAKLLCQSTPMSALAIDPKGLHMVTAGLDRSVKVWDVRALSGPMAVYKLRLPANQLDVSQRGVLALTQGSYCEMYSNLMIGEKAKAPYLRQICDGIVHCLRFCPYEDVLGVTTSKGFQSLLVPGAGEPNFDALEDNPFQTKSQRREHEIHALLEKIPAELITLDPNEIAGVDEPTLREKIEAKKSIFFLKPPKIDFQSRRKMKGKGGSVKAARNKQIVKDSKRKEFINELRATKKKVIEDHLKTTDDFIPLSTEEKATSSVLDRFKPKEKHKT